MPDKHGTISSLYSLCSPVDSSDPSHHNKLHLLKISNPRCYSKVPPSSSMPQAINPSSDALAVTYVHLFGNFYPKVWLQGPPKLIYAQGHKSLFRCPCAHLWVVVALCNAINCTSVHLWKHFCITPLGCTFSSSTHTSFPAFCIKPPPLHNGPRLIIGAQCTLPWLSWENWKSKGKNVLNFEIQGVILVKNLRGKKCYPQTKHS